MGPKQTCVSWNFFRGFARFHALDVLLRLELLPLPDLLRCELRHGGFGVGSPRHHRPAGACEGMPQRCARFQWRFFGTFDVVRKKSLRM